MSYPIRYSSLLLPLLILAWSSLCQASGVFEAGSLAQAVTDPPPDGSIIDPGQGRHPYSNEYNNPADKVPMVRKEQGRKAIKEPESELPENVCPLLHARSDFREHSRFERAQIFVKLEVKDKTAVIYHNSRDWIKAARAGGGIKLLSTDKEPESGKWTARVSYSEGYLCGKGIFVVEVDDRLTEDVSILAIDDGVMLIKPGDDLAYMQTKDAEPLQWRMIWDTDISLEYEKQVIDSKPKVKKSKKSKKKRRAKKKYQKKKR